MYIGVMTAPVIGSGSCPAWIACVDWAAGENRATVCEVEDSGVEEDNVVEENGVVVEDSVVEEVGDDIIYIS
jgi:hypothetical protein